MFILEKVEIKGFWHRFDASCSFNENVNIIIGRNGTGKTTFMNILHSILTVDLIGLSENDFESAVIHLKNGEKRKRISVEKIENLESPFPIVSYKISKKTRHLHLIGIENRSYSSSLRRRINEESSELRRELDELTSVSSLSVYRLRNDDEYEIRDRHGSRVVSPVDFRLSQVLTGLTEFQLGLAEKAQEVSKSLQREVLGSVLYCEDDRQNTSLELNFDKEEEQARLITAYAQLNAADSDMRKKIRFHVSSIHNMFSEIIAAREGKNPKPKIDIKPLEAFSQTRKIINLSLSAKQKTEEIYSQIDLFLKIIKEFITDKEFNFISGRLVISNQHENIDHAKLSSGEKQLIILLAEALLQKSNKHIFLADEPELSLHITWQRKIIPAIKQINPNAQVIVATHSPEVASKFKDTIFDMEKLIHG
jgi:predicted ATP-dependent endonuclease of OLD family